MVEAIGRRTRSWLFTPSTRPERFANAAKVGADVLILDLEDSVAPGDKVSARETALHHLGQPSRAMSHALRINGLDTAAGFADVSALVAAPADPDFLILPKMESEGHVVILDRILASAGKQTRIIGLIESVRGSLALERIAIASPRLAGLMLGAADMAADLGAEPTWDAMAAARARLVAACALGNLLPIDSPFFDTKDAAGSAREVAAAKSFGFGAKAAIHPGQVAAINDALTPTQTEVDHARKVLEVNKAGVGTVEGRMIDEAVARRARRVLAAAGG